MDFRFAFTETVERLTLKVMEHWYIFPQTTYAFASIFAG